MHDLGSAGGSWETLAPAKRDKAMNVCPIRECLAILIRLLSFLWLHSQTFFFTCPYPIPSTLSSSDQLVDRRHKVAHFLRRGPAVGDGRPETRRHRAGHSDWAEVWRVWRACGNRAEHSGQRAPPHADGEQGHRVPPQRPPLVPPSATLCIIAPQVMERMEELRSMLGWILVHWRAQKQQWLHRKNRLEPVQDNIYTEAAMCSPLAEVNKHWCIYCKRGCGFKPLVEMFVLFPYLILLYH